MKRLLLFLLLLISNLIFAQQQRKLDSLNALLAKLPAEGRSFVGDTTRVRVLCEMGEEVIQKDSCILYFNGALMIAEKLSFAKGLARGYNGKAYRLKNQKKYLQAQEMFYKALFYAKKTIDYTQLGKSLQGIADIKLITLQYPKAISFYLHAIKIHEKAKNYKGILICNNNLAIIYDNSGNVPQTILFYNKCLSLNKTYKVAGFDGHIYNNLAFFYQKLKRYPAALENIKRAIVAYNNGGSYYKIYQSSTYLIWAEIEFAKSNLAKAKKYAQMALQLNNNSSVNNNVKIYKLIFLIAKKEKNLEKALEVFEKIKAIDDTLSKQTFLQQLNSTKFEYQSLQQQDILSVQSQQIKSQKQFEILLGIIILMVCIFGVLLFRNNNILKKKNNAIEEQKIIIEDSKLELVELNENLENRITERTSELSKANKELIAKNKEIIEALFKGQSIERKRVATELHDNLGGTLSAIKWRLEAIQKDNLTIKEQKIYESTCEMVKNAYDEIRLISHNLLPAILEQKGIKPALEKLVDEINIDGRISVHLVIKPDMIELSKEISLSLYSITMEILNNILKHAQATKVNINFTKLNEELSLVIEDNGKGFDVNSLANSGMGLKNIQSRVRAINGVFEIESDSTTGTRIALRFNEVLSTES